MYDHKHLRLAFSSGLPDSSTLPTMHLETPLNWFILYIFLPICAVNSFKEVLLPFHFSTFQCLVQCMIQSRQLSNAWLFWDCILICKMGRHWTRFLLRSLPLLHLRISALRVLSIPSPSMMRDSTNSTILGLPLKSGSNGGLLKDSVKRRKTLADLHEKGCEDRSKDGLDCPLGKAF